MPTAYHFFLANAGYSYDPKTQTPMQGRRECARKLADAERGARDAGYSFHWGEDPHADSSDFSNRKPAYRLWCVDMFNPEGITVASLGGIDFGRDGSPWSDPYRRVVEAELACEIPADES